MSDLRDQLQASLGAAYTLERELGGGGMSRVFVATETALGRRVVVKVLSPELAQGLSADRFAREIRFAAALQDPHIVPVLTAGVGAGLPYYTMPFVEGESLRARLQRGDPLSTGEAVGILRDVALALEYAHKHEIVHRDIKPENVLLAGRTAVVADFGIAKAVSAARSQAGATLTSMGQSIGTPAYMAPEQAAGDPADQRADLYAWGMVAYELLAGAHPFADRTTAQALIKAQLMETPVPLASRRPDLSPALAAIVMRCVEKDAAQRPASADEILQVIDAVPSAGAHSTPVALASARSRVSLGSALAIWAGATVAVAVLTRAAIVGIGLPDWVFPGAMLVMAMGLPMIVFTAWVHRQRFPNRSGPSTSGPHGTMATIAFKASPHVSWRRTAMGGVGAVGLFLALTAGWMVLRALGIGPAGSLMAAGRLGERERMILADFTGSATDTLLAPTVTEAFRTDLAESANLNVMPVNAVREVLRRMQRPPSAPVDFQLAREIATREGIKAVVAGNVAQIGGGYVLSARLVSAQTGEEMATFRETAAEAKDIIPAIGKLSRKLRSRVGESLKTIQNAPALDQVTTTSLPALQKYVAANRAIRTDGDFERGIALLEEAIALDTSFAMAYRRLSVELGNRGLSPVRMQAAIQKAYDHRDRLSDAERYLTIGGYYSNGPKPDEAKAISAYESLVDVQPNNPTALNNLANSYRLQHEFAKAEVMAKRALAVQQSTATYYTNLIYAQHAQGKMREADETIALMARNVPQHPSVGYARAGAAILRGRYDSARVVLDSMKAARSNDPDVETNVETRIAAMAAIGGKLDEALVRMRRANDAWFRQGRRDAPLQSMLDDAELDLWFRDQKARALTQIERALATHPLDSLEPIERPYARLAKLYSLAGRPDLARTMLAAFDRRRADVALGDDERTRHEAAGHVAIAERRYDEALREFSNARLGDSCAPCSLPNIARAYDLAGNADSAIAVFSRYIEQPSEAERFWTDQHMLAGAHKRLGELYEETGDRAKAASQYAAFIEQWKNADPELQPMVKQVREKLATLQRAEKP